MIEMEVMQIPCRIVLRRLLSSGSLSRRSGSGKCSRNFSCRVWPSGSKSWGGESLLGYGNCRFIGKWFGRWKFHNGRNGWILLTIIEFKGWRRLYFRDCTIKWRTQFVSVSPFLLFLHNFFSWTNYFNFFG